MATNNPANEPPAPAPFPDAPITDTDEAQRRLEAALGGEGADDATPPQASEPEPGEDAAPAEEQPSGEDPAEDPEATPPIEPPRSWSKEARKAWDSLPRETQDFILHRETERDAEVRRGQNDIAEQRKAVEAERKAIAQERQQWLAQAQPVLTARIAELQAHPFAKLTPQERMNLRQADPARFVDLKDDYEFRERQVAQELNAHQNLARQQAEEQQKQTKAWIDEQHSLIERFTPEFIDEKSGAENRQRAEKYLRSYGFSQEEITGLRDHRLFRVLSDAMRGLEARDKAKIAQAKVAKVPPVARPGAAQSPVEMSHQKRTALRDQLAKTSSTEEQARILEQLL